MKVLVIQQKMIGDVLTSSVLLEALRKKYPAARLHYLIYRHTLPVVENNPNIDKFILYDDSFKKAAKLYPFLKKIRQENYDIIIDVYAKVGTALMSAFSGAAQRISYHKWYTARAYTQTFRSKQKPQTNAGLAIEKRMQLLQALSSDFPIELKPKIYLTPQERTWAGKMLSDAGISDQRPLIMCGILGSSSEKTYPLPFMARILDYIVAGSDAQLLFNYIPKQQEEAEELLRMCKPATRQHIFFDVFGGNLREFIAITSHCDALIGNEGGAVNMAKALNIPTFSIFSPQIKKEDWSIYEDGRTNVSVHVNDFHPEVLKELSKKELSAKGPAYYRLLEPELIFPLLDQFLTNISLKKDYQDH